MNPVWIQMNFWSATVLSLLGRYSTVIDMLLFQKKKSRLPSTFPGSEPPPLLSFSTMPVHTCCLYDTSYLFSLRTVGVQNELLAILETLIYSRFFVLPKAALVLTPLETTSHPVLETSVWVLIWRQVELMIYLKAQWFCLSTNLAHPKLRDLMLLCSGKNF